MTLKQKYEQACNEYVEEFYKKQGFDHRDASWVADQVGGIILIGDFYFTFMDIVWDINSNQPKGLIIKWHDESLANPKKSTDYFTYTKKL